MLQFICFLATFPIRLIAGLRLKIAPHIIYCRNGDYTHIDTSFLKGLKRGRYRQENFIKMFFFLSMEV